MNGLRSIVALSRDSLRGVDVQEIEGEKPAIEWVDPRSLFVEESYQRDVRESGTAMIRRIVGRFSWHKFKPPVCFRSAEFGDVLVVVDGQHTAIAATTRGIDLIPVLIVSAASIIERAHAFVGHNRDRLGLTMQAVFHAELAAGDPAAKDMLRACEAAGAKILTKAINTADARPVGETMAVGTIRTVLKRHGVEHLTRVMRVLVAAKRGPIKAQEIGAVSAVILNCNGADIDDRLATLIGSDPAKNWEARCVNEAGSLPQRLAAVWTRSVRTTTGPAPRKPEQIVVSTPKPSAPGNFPVKSESSKAVSPPSSSGFPKPPSQHKQIPESVKPIVQTVKAPVPTSPTRVPPAPPRAAVILTQTNGITVTAEGAVARMGRNGTVNVGDRGAAMLARLVHVMPAQIVMERMAQFIFPGLARAREMVDELVVRINAEIGDLGLEIYTVKGSGYMVRDKANSGNVGDNFLRA